MISVQQKLSSCLYIIQYNIECVHFLNTFKLKHEKFSHRLSQRVIFPQCLTPLGQAQAAVVGLSVKEIKKMKLRAAMKQEAALCLEL